MRLGTFLQAALVLLVLFPGNIPHMQIGDQHLPFIDRQVLGAFLSIRPGAGMRSSEEEGPGIARVV
jgi:hypothetical protein